MAAVLTAGGNKIRVRNPYPVYPRKLGNGVAWYYQTYTTDGQRTAARSAGQRTKSAALAWLAKRHKD